MHGAEHCLPQIVVAAARGPVRQPRLLRGLRAGEGLLSAVVDARDTKGQKLQRDARDYLVVRTGSGGETELLSRDFVMIIKNRDVPISEIPVRTHHCTPRIEAVEVVLWRPKPFGDGDEGR